MILKGIKRMYTIVEEKKIDEALKYEWKKLWFHSEYRNYFNSFEWFESCIDIFKIKNYKVIKIYKNDSLICIIPLEKKGTTLISPGDKYLDKSTLLVKNIDIEMVKQLKSYLYINKQSLILTELDQDLAAMFGEKQMKEISSENPYIDLTTDINNIIKTKEKHHIENIIKKNHELSVQIYKSNTYKYLDIIYDIEKKSNKPQKKREMFSDPKAKNIFCKLAATKYPIVAILYHNKTPIAHLFGIKNKKNNFMAYHMAYKKEFKKYQPGKILILFLINFLKEKQYTVFDLSRGNSLLKKHFSKNSRINYSIYVNCKLYTKIHVYVRKYRKKIILKIKSKIKKYIK